MRNMGSQDFFPELQSSIRETETKKSASLVKKAENRLKGKAATVQVWV